MISTPRVEMPVVFACTVAQDGGHLSTEGALPRAAARVAGRLLALTPYPSLSSLLSHPLSVNLAPPTRPPSHF